jgi:hypothetical protein
MLFSNFNMAAMTISEARTAYEKGVDLKKTKMMA